MANTWLDLIGTLKDNLRLGLSGVRLKNSSGNLLVRNTGDSADAEVTASKLNVSGEVIDINSDATAAAADWKYTIQRPVAGMTAAVVLTLPVDNGTPSQVLSTDGDGALSWISAGNTAPAVKCDTSTLAFGTASPLSLFSTGASDIIHAIEIIVDTQFDGTPSVSVGVAGTVSKYMAATEVLLTDAAETRFRVHPNKTAQGAEALIATYAAGGAAAGSARILVYYSSPS